MFLLVSTRLTALFTVWPGALALIMCCKQKLEMKLFEASVEANGDEFPWLKRWLRVQSMYDESYPVVVPHLTLPTVCYVSITLRMVWTLLQHQK